MSAARNRGPFKVAAPGADSKDEGGSHQRRILVQKHILLVDDDPEVSQAVANYFDPADYKFHTLADGDRILEVLPRVKPDLVLLDVYLPTISGLDILKEIKEKDPELPVIIISGQFSTDNAIDAMRDGAFEYITKPFRLDKLQEIVESAVGQRSSKKRPPPAAEVAVKPDQIVGRSPELVEIAKMIGQVARTEAPVLILGEPGTGKELIARAIHRNSPRAAAPLVMNRRHPKSV